MTVLVYIASPYTLGPSKEENVRKSMEMGDKLIRLGYVPFLPLLTHYQHLLYPQSYEMWMKLDFEMVKHHDNANDEIALVLPPVKFSPP